MTALEENAIDVEETDPDPNQDTSALADGDALDRPVRQPPSAAAVKINVEGAFIVDDEIADRNGVGSEHVHWEHKDIRLPHHTDVVSHVAVDVGLAAPFSPVYGLDTDMMNYTDWWLSGQTRLLLPRTRVERRRWSPKLPELRDRPDRFVH